MEAEGTTESNCRVLRKVTRKETSRNRKGPETLLRRRFRKLVGSQEWFRLDEDDEDQLDLQQYPKKTGKNTRPREKRIEASNLSHTHLGEP